MSVPHFMADIGPGLASAGWPIVPILPHDATAGPNASDKARDDVVKGRGKAPGLGNRDGWKLLCGWQNIGVPRSRQVAAWGKMPPCGIGVVCGVGDPPH